MTLREHLIREEDEILHLYYDPKGIPTIGVGCNLRDVRVPDSIARQITITPEASRELFELRLQSAEADVARYLPWTMELDEVRRGVLVAMTYQMGIGNAVLGTGLQGFGRMLSAMHVGDYFTAAAHLMDSKMAREDSPARSERLAETLRSGEWQ